MDLYEYGIIESTSFHQFRYRDSENEMVISFTFKGEYGASNFEMHPIVEDSIMDALRNYVKTNLIYVDDIEEGNLLYRVLNDYVKLHKPPITISTVAIPNRNAIIISYWDTPNALSYIKGLLDVIREAIKNLEKIKIIEDEIPIEEETTEEEIIIQQGDDNIEEIEETDTIKMGVVE